MNAETASERLPIVRLAVKGGCPVCAAVKHFQDSLSGHLRAEGGTQLCNFHAWLLAKSAPAEVAASLFLDALRAGESDKSTAPPSSCIACNKVHEEESTRLKEVARELERPAMAEWLEQHATFCLRHIHELKNRAPASSQKRIEKLRIKNKLEIEAELKGFLEHARKGDHTGGGVLGRAAEFLVAQRGILD
jgi:hypothetical protein